MRTLERIPAAIEFVFQKPHATQFTVAPEDVTNSLCLGGLNHQLAVAHFVAEWDEAADPHALAL